MTAPCAGLHALFDAEDEASQQQAAAVCSGCQMRQACHDGAVERDEPQGTWGGRWMGEPPAADDVMTVAEPGDLAAGGRLPRRKVPPEHGQRAMYGKCRDGTDGRACARCMEANAKHRADWLAGKKRRVTTAAGLALTAIDLEATA